MPATGWWLPHPPPPLAGIMPCPFPFPALVPAVGRADVEAAEAASERNRLCRKETSLAQRVSLTEMPSTSAMYFSTSRTHSLYPVW